MDAPRTEEELMAPGITNLALHKILLAGRGKVAAETVVAKVSHGR
jgi:hypothetical protein